MVLKSEGVLGTDKLLVWRDQLTLVHEKHLEMFVMNTYGWKEVFYVKNNDPHKYASKLYSFTFILWTNTVGPYVE